MTEEQYLEAILRENLGIVMITAIAILAAKIAGDWQVFKKADKPGWASLIPFYSEYISYEVFWGNGWLFLFIEAFTLISNYVRSDSVIGVTCLIGALIVQVMHCSKIAKAFGKSAWYALGLLIAYPIFICILGFSSARYLGVPED